MWYLYDVEEEGKTKTFFDPKGKIRSRPKVSALKELKVEPCSGPYFLVGIDKMLMILFLTPQHS